MKSISKENKIRIGEVDQSSILAEFEMHIKQMIQTINCTPIYSGNISLERYFSLLSEKISFIQIKLSNKELRIIW